jgi:hypothetical protein
MTKTDDVRKIFIVAMIDGQQEGTDTFDVLEGTVVNELDSGALEVLVTSPSEQARLTCARQYVFDTRDAAEKRRLALTLFAEREKLKGEVGGHVGFYPKLLRQPQCVFLTTNPLRGGEPKAVFAARGNTWGKDDNAQKIIQVAGSIWEDIDTLFRVLYVLGLANDYSKKLIGKYVVIEMNSLFATFGRLQERDQRYGDLYLGLKNNLKLVGRKYGRLLIEERLRNKIAAHRDGNLDIIETARLWRNITRFNIIKHLEVFGKHIYDLRQLYPDEARECFRGPLPLPHVPRTERDENGNDDYEPFDPPWP